jgi:hypothetical protein
MSTYLAAWAVVPDTYGKRTDDENIYNVYVSILQNISILIVYLF